MPVDLARLETMAAFTDPDLGITERFVDVPLESGSTVGVLSLPLGPPDTTGWVVTHSFGPEQPQSQCSRRRDRSTTRGRGIARAAVPLPRLRGQRARRVHSLDRVTRPGHGRCNAGAPRPHRLSFDRHHRCEVRWIMRLARGDPGLAPIMSSRSLPRCEEGDSCERLVRASAIVELAKAADDGAPDALVGVEGRRLDQHPGLRHHR